MYYSFGKQFRFEKILNCFCSIIAMFQILFFDDRKLLLHILFQKHRHVLSINCSGEYFVQRSILIKIVDPEFYRFLLSWSEIKVLADIAQNKICFSITI